MLINKTKALSPQQLLLEIAQAALDDRDLDTRIHSLALQRWAKAAALADIPKPKTSEPVLLALCASIAELFAQRMKQPPPAWTRTIGSIETPIFLFHLADKYPSFRERLLRESPEPLRKRNLFGPESKAWTQ